MRLGPALLITGMVLGSYNGATAQPDPRQMSGLPLPDAELSDGTISVRVIRGQLSNNVTDHAVELRQGDVVETALTDTEGRATFLTLNPGQQVHVATVLDGERIESQAFAVPGRGGVRLMLVGIDPANPPVLARSGLVTFGGESFIQVELIEESIEVYYVLELLNLSDTPVEPPVAIAIDLPTGAQGVTVLPGSSARTRVDGTRAELPGPFEPGATPLRIAYILPYSGERLAVSQSFPIDLDSVLLSVEQWEDVDFVSTQIARRMEVPADSPEGTDYLIGAGPGISAGSVLSIELTGLPHRSTTPSTLTLVIALGILGVGGWGALVPAGGTENDNTRKLLQARKEQLFGDLVKIERQYRTDKMGSTKYASRRGEVLSALEKVYSELEQDDVPDVLSVARYSRRS